MKIDNLEAFVHRGFLKAHDGCSYQGKIIARKKDGNKTRNDEDATLIRDYEFKDYNDIAKSYEQIKYICDGLNARFYLNITPKKDRNVAFGMMETLMNRIKSNEYSKLAKIHKSERSKETGLKGEKLWFLDVDFDCVNHKIPNFKRDGELEKSYGNIFGNVGYFEIDLKMIYKTPNGFHLITSPFNRNVAEDVLFDFVSMFLPEVEMIEKVEVKTNHPTLCYFTAKDSIWE